MTTGIEDDGSVIDAIESAEAQVKEFVDCHDDDDQIAGEELERVFALAYGRPADASDRQTGLWSLICAAV